MDIPAPTILGPEPTTAIWSAPGLEPLLAACLAAGRRPVLLHELGGEKERGRVGPRELMEETRARLEAMELPAETPLTRWGLGARVREPEAAAQFATAHYTWFTLDLARELNPRASKMSLDALDAAIVELEDRGILRAEWHQDYLDRAWEIAPGDTLRIPDETLARAAVKCAPAFALAGEIIHGLRTCWAGRGAAPDLEISLAPAGPPMTRAEYFFAAMEFQRLLGGVHAVAPPLGYLYEPGGEPETSRPERAAWLRSQAGVAAVSAPLSLPAELWAEAAAAIPEIAGSTAHLDTTETGRLTWLRQMAERDPALFREWLAAAQLAFPLAASDWPLSITEEDVRFLPRAEDAELAGLFLDTRAGRQLLLSTFAPVSASAPGARARERKG